MKDEYVAQYERLEREHWWWLARRRIVRSALKRITPSPEESGKRTLLDIGCGAGLTLNALQKDFSCHGLEPDERLAAAARSNSGADIHAGGLGAPHDLSGRTFDRVLLLDVIEHIDDDVSALRSAALFLEENGAMLINVPAMPWLWSIHDEINEHKRRYTRATLKDAVTKAGLKTVFLRYWGTALAPAAYAARRLSPQQNTSEFRVSIPGAAVNRLLENVILAEYGLTRLTGAPFGLSLIAVVRRSQKER